MTAVPVLGVLSRWNGTIDLEVAKQAGIEGVILKAVDGVTLDPKFVEYVNEANRVGMPWAPGIKPDLRRDNPAAQADAMWAAVQAVGDPSLEPSIDYDLAGDTTPADATPEHIALFLRQLVDRFLELGLDPSIYVLDNSWNARVAPAGIDFSDRTMRIADYRGVTLSRPELSPPPSNARYWEAWLQPMDPPDAVTGWATWDAWQFSADGNGLGRVLLGPKASMAVSCNIVKPDAWDRWRRR